MLQQSKWLNVFQYCKYLRFLGHVMVLLVLAIVAFLYHAVVLVTYGPLAIGHGVLVGLGSTIVVAVFSLLAMMVVWSYMATVVQDPGRVPAGWHPFADEQQACVELERLSFSEYYFDRRDPRRPRWCKRCQAWKPERAHHCSVMGRCVLRMDHYCIWVVNCVGLLNYKFFLLFLFYAATASLLALLLSIGPCVAFFSDEAGQGNPESFLAVVTSGAFAASLGGFLAMHAQLVAANCTSIEMYEKDRCHPWPYNKGARRNFEDVFGRNWRRWLVPHHTEAERRALVDTWLTPRLLAVPGLAPPV